jgi:hypothetical protein
MINRITNLIAIFIFFVFTKGYAQRDYSKLDDFHFDTVNISGYIITVGHSGYLLDTFKGKFIKTDSGFYKKSFFIPLNEKGSPISSFLEKYYPPVVSSITNFENYAVDSMYIYCTSKLGCDFLIHSYWVS